MSTQKQCNTVHPVSLREQFIRVQRVLETANDISVAQTNLILQIKQSVISLNEQIKLNRTHTRCNNVILRGSILTLWG
jgi:hypothetical protein